MLTPLELDIMKAVWVKPPTTVRDAQDFIRPGRQLAYTTVMTIMDRLYHKGFLKRTLQSRTYLYEPAIDFTEVRDDAVEKLVKSFFGSKEKLKEFLTAEPENVSPRVIHETPLPSSFDETLL
jgi:predicted transcriptional regulator